MHFSKSVFYERVSCLLLNAKQMEERKRKGEKGENKGEKGEKEGGRERNVMFI